MTQVETLWLIKQAGKPYREIAYRRYLDANPNNTISHAEAQADQSNAMMLDRTHPHAAVRRAAGGANMLKGWRDRNPLTSYTGKALRPATGTMLGGEDMAQAIEKL